MGRMNPAPTPPDWTGSSAAAVNAAWHRHETRQAIDKVRRCGERVNAAWAWVDARPALNDDPRAVNAALRLRTEHPDLTAGQLEAVLVRWLAEQPVTAGEVTEETA